MRIVLLTGLAAFLSACSNGGNLTLEPGAVITKRKGSPYVTVNQGGKALVVESGKTVTTGVHGWVAVQNVASRNIADTSSGNRIVVNKTNSGAQ